MTESTVPKILNVNDDESTRYIVTRMLQRAGYIVIEAATGRDALKQTQSEHPALVVLDVKLPDINGVEVCRLIKTDPTTANIPVLHLSATKIGTEDRAYGLESGADGYLTQPVEPPVLTATVKALLRLSHAETLARSSAKAWEAVFGAIGDGVCLLDGDGRIVRCNRAMADISRLPREAMVGRAYVALVEEVFPGVRLTDDRKMAANAKRTVVEAQTSERNGGRWLRLTAEPVTAMPDDLVDVATVCVVADITDSKDNELRQRGFLRDILASVTEGRLRLCVRPEDLPARLTPTGDELVLTKSAIRDLRSATRAAAKALAFPIEREQELETAVGEAAMNAVVHAGRGLGQVCTDGKNTVQVWVEDEGAGIAIDSLHRATLERGYTTAGTLGHGFWMILKTCDRVFLLTRRLGIDDRARAGARRDEAGLAAGLR